MGWVVLVVSSFCEWWGGWVRVTHAQTHLSLPMHLITCPVLFAHQTVGPCRPTYPTGPCRPPSRGSCTFCRVLLLLSSFLFTIIPTFLPPTLTSCTRTSAFFLPNPSSYPSNPTSYTPNPKLLYFNPNLLSTSPASVHFRIPSSTTWQQVDGSRSVGCLLCWFLPLLLTV